ncbi:DUF3306 domain-containing protein [Methylibium sp.]|uniref:DUF3306 domain-containing protein n=1 Tax=Methylibium sp. TaxID=2067992 RepID=UPI00286D58EA|nr:DUF3306 domain-containing protein [Methylibium sp.]
MSEENFFSRWSRRKQQGGAEALVPAEAAPLPVAVPASPRAAGATLPAAVPAAIETLPEHGDVPAEPAAVPLPTLDDVAALAPGDEVSRFVARGVDETVKRAALKKLFADPHFNVMDGLDTYIDDYSIFEPIPAAMLRQMNQSKFLGLFDDEEVEQAAALEQAAAPLSLEAPAQDADPAAMAEAVPHASDEDPDLQLQPDDAARRPGAEDGARPERV